MRSPWGLRTWAMDSGQVEAYSVATDYFRGLGESPWPPSVRADMSAFLVQGDEDAGDRPFRLEGSVAVVDLKGPLEREPGLLALIFGATSYVGFAAALAAADADPEVRSIRVEVDSPGGDIQGAHEAMVALRDSRKPTHAKIVGMGASAAIWVASAAGRITAGPTAFVGSVGVVVRALLSDDDEVRQFVSSQTPLKGAPVGSEAGDAALQQLVDDAAAVMLADIAANRKVDAATAAHDFGGGAVMIAARAVTAGMIDAVEEPEAPARTARRGALRAMSETTISVDELVELRAAAARLKTSDAALAAAQAKAKEHEGFAASALKAAATAKEAVAAADLARLEAEAATRKLECTAFVEALGQSGRIGSGQDELAAAHYMRDPEAAKAMWESLPEGCARPTATAGFGGAKPGAKPGAPAPPVDGAPGTFADLAALNGWLHAQATADPTVGYTARYNAYKAAHRDEFAILWAAQFPRSTH